MAISLVPHTNADKANNVVVSVARAIDEVACVNNKKMVFECGSVKYQ